MLHEKTTSYGDKFIMAKRPVFIPQESGDLFVRTIYVDFEWFPGMAIVQKQKSVAALHRAAISNGLGTNPLEVSSKSNIELGVSLSAFNLTFTTQKLMHRLTVESAYQGSKIFADGGPYRELIYAPSRVAKQDPRLKDSGELKGFEFFGEKWSLEPKTAFYDWIYINALYRNEMLAENIWRYDAFTDIEFNPEKSLNCQAYSVALYKALSGRQLLREAIGSKEAYLDIVSSAPVNNSSENTAEQPRLL